MYVLFVQVGGQHRRVARPELDAIVGLLIVEVDRAVVLEHRLARATPRGVQVDYGQLFVLHRCYLSELFLGSNGINDFLLLLGRHCIFSSRY